MKQYLSKVFEQQTLSKEEAKEALLQIGSGNVNPSQIAAFLTSYIIRPITVDELEGFRAAMLDLAINIDLSAFNALDVCGTGGDGKDTFNISTTAALVVAGAGQNVAKHGNHGVSSPVGSSTVLEYLGVKFTNDESFLQKKIEQAGICYLHAPLFHPAMKYVAPIRKELGFKTFFNLLGPLLNPARVQMQYTGVYSMEVFDLYTRLFRRGRGDFAVVHALDGYDEISLTGEFKLETREMIMHLFPHSLGYPTIKQEELHGGNTVEEAAKIMLNVLNDKATDAQKNAVIANAAIALHIGKKISIQDAQLLAQESIESGKALKSFKKLIE